MIISSVLIAGRHQSTALQAAYFDWLAHQHEEDERTYARAAVQVMVDTLGLADASHEQIARTVTTQTFKAGPPGGGV